MLPLVPSAMFSRYFLASLVSLGLDFLVLTLLVTFAGAAAAPSSAIAYAAGALLHYVISRHFVFAPGWLHQRRWSELLGFLGIGLLGLVVTVVIVEAGTRLLGAPLSLAKVAAVGVSFFLNYLLRRRFVFRR